MHQFLGQISVSAQELGLPTGTGTVGEGLVNVVNLLFGLIGSLAVAALIYGGVQLSLSQGDPARVKTARATIQYAVVGIVLAMSTYLVVWFITHNLGSGG